MQQQKFFLSAFFLTMFFGLFALAAAAQQTAPKTFSPELSVTGIRLGTRAAAKAFLGVFQPTISDDGRPAYYFFNRSATQVLKLTGASFEDRFLITGIEVYKVGKSYARGHFQSETIDYFKTENDVFVGYKQSKASAWTGIPNVDGKDHTGPKAVIEKLGAPTERLAEGERETLIYKLPEVDLTDENGRAAKFAYEARYEFGDGKLRRFVLKITPKQ